MTYIILIIIPVVIVVWAIMIYNGIIHKKNLTKEAWSNVDVQLNRRYNLIPNLVETVKGYMNYEKSVLSSVTEIRAKCLSIQSDSINERSIAETSLSGVLGQFLAVVENYPDLKASKTFLTLQQDLTDTEDQIQLARRYYNGTVRNYNIAIQTFPNNLVAKLFNFGSLDYFQLESSTEKLAPKVDLSE